MYLINYVEYLKWLLEWFSVNNIFVASFLLVGRIIEYYHSLLSLSIDLSVNSVSFEKVGDWGEKYRLQFMY